jgi:SagB-type dehydrogenase family enzyme
MNSIEMNRQFLRSDLWEDWRVLDTDQKKGMPPPPVQKPYPDKAALVDLVAPEVLTVGKMPLIEAIKHRKSRRKYTGGLLTLEELSFLLWATQGIRRGEGANGGNVGRLRTVPSAGARHPFETYLLVSGVEGVDPGLYRYLFLEHKLCLLSADTALKVQVDDACYGQFVMESSVVFICTVIPIRTEWRYSIISHKVIAQDSGHVCQNLYLACESIGAGTCAIGAYIQKKIDPILGVDGKDEFTIYVATVGKV